MAAQDGKSNDASRRPQKLVFMPNFSNPLKDSKRSENRKMVAKWAMINRPKAALPATPPTSTPSPPNRRTSPSDATSPEPLALPPLSPESIASSTPHLVRADPGPVRGPFGFIAKGTSDYYSLPTTEDDLPYRPRERDVNNRIAEARQRHFVKQKAFRQRTHDPDTSATESFDDTGHTALTAVARTSGDARASTFAKMNPDSLLPSVKDPFDCLPVKYNSHTQELLYLYLNAHFLSPAFTQGSIEIPQRVKTYRQQTWFPLILESKATLNALVAYIESTPDLPVKARDPDFLLNHVQAAYEGMRHALSNPRTETDDSICVAVVLLMLTAQRLGDIATFRAHATGLTLLLAARTKAFRNNKMLRDRETERWQGLNLKITGAPSSNPCRYCQDAHLRPSRSQSPESPEASGGSDPVGGFSSEDSSVLVSPTGNPKIMPSQPRGSGFFDLINRGYVSHGMSGFVEQVLIWSRLAEQARRDRLSAAAAATHAWVDERPGKLPPLDTACQYAVRLCLYLSSWLEGGHSCSIVRRMTMAVYGSLRSPHLNPSQLLEECPHVLLWLAFVSGPFIEDDMSRQWMMCLLVRARHAVSFSSWDVDELLEHISSLFLWTSTMTPGARRFSDENLWDLGTATVWMQNPF